MIKKFIFGVTVVITGVVFADLVEEGIMKVVRECKKSKEPNKGEPIGVDNKDEGFRIIKGHRAAGFA